MPPPPSTKFPLTGNAQFNTYSKSWSGILAQIGDSAGAQNVDGRTIQISYDSQSGTYNLVDLDGYSVRLPKESTISGIYNVFTKNSRSYFDQLKLYNSARAGGAAIPLTYVNFGMWQHRVKSTGYTTQTAMVFGFPTPVNSIPRTGNASYRTFVQGSSLTYGANAGVREVGGNATFGVDFANETVSTQLNLAYINGATQTPIGSFSGSGYLYGAGGFGGGYESSVPNFSWGVFTGALYGPNAEEMGYAFDIERTNAPLGVVKPTDFQETIVGTVVGKRQ